MVFRVTIGVRGKRWGRNTSLHCGDDFFSCIAFFRVYDLEFSKKFSILVNEKIMITEKAETMTATKAAFSDILTVILALILTVPVLWIVAGASVQDDAIKTSYRPVTDFDLTVYQGKTVLSVTYCDTSDQLIRFRFTDGTEITVNSGKFTPTVK